jgi:hypothetical protein
VARSGQWQARATAIGVVIMVAVTGMACRRPPTTPPGSTTTTTAGGPVDTSTTTTTPGEEPPPGTAGDPGNRPWVPVPRARVAEECGLDPTAMDAAARRIGTGFTVVRYGKLCWSGGSSSTTQPYSVFSVTKTWGGLLVGIVSARSSMRDTDLASKWLTASQRSGLNANATVAHILAMTGTSRSLATGQKNTFAYDTVGSRELNKLNDLMSNVIAREPQNFEGASDIYDFAARVVIPKLGMTGATWPRGSAIAYGLQASVADLGRLGLLILRKGMWNGERLITEEYLYRMAHPSFPDSNTGLGYLLWLNADNMKGPSGRSHPDCAPYAQWDPNHAAPFAESKRDYRGSPFPDQANDDGVAWAAGLGGQWTEVHRGLDLVISARDVTGGGNWVIWDAVRPALLAHDAVYRGNESGFCAAYRRGTYAPSLLSPWARP